MIFLFSAQLFSFIFSRVSAVFAVSDISASNQMCLKG